MQNCMCHIHPLMIIIKIKLWKNKQQEQHSNKQFHYLKLVFGITFMLMYLLLLCAHTSKHTNKYVYK